MSRRVSTFLFLLLVGCVGDDPLPAQTVAPQADGGAGGDGGTSPNGDGGALDSMLELEGQRLVLVAGTSDVLQFKVTKRRDVGELSFKVKGIPEGVTAASVVTLAATANAINVPVSSVASTKHGDFVVSIEADGQPFQASAPLVVRGTAGSKDTGFGSDGSVLVPAPSGDGVKVAGLADDRVVFGVTAGGKPALTILDVKGASAPAIDVTQNGTLIDLAPTADGGFVTLTSATNELRMVWYSNAGVALSAGLVVSTVTVPFAKLAATPKGTIFAQAKTGGAVTVARYAAGAADPAFPEVTVPATDNQAGLRFLAGASDGSAWVGMRSGMSQEKLVRVSESQAVTSKPLAIAESCSVGGAVGNDLVAYCANDQPSTTLRRFKPTLELESTFGTNGYLPIDGTNLQAILGSSGGQLYVAAFASGAPNGRRITAYDGVGGVRPVFAANGLLTVTGADDLPTVALDPRGRLLFAAPEHTTVANVRLYRFWD
jgi:hypothetical protein